MSRHCVLYWAYSNSYIKVCSIPNMKYFTLNIAEPINTKVRHFLILIILLYVEYLNFPYLFHKSRHKWFIEGQQMIFFVKSTFEDWSVGKPGYLWCEIIQCLKNTMQALFFDKILDIPQIFTSRCTMWKCQYVKACFESFVCLSAIHL